MSRPETLPPGFIAPKMDGGALRGRNAPSPREDKSRILLLLRESGGGRQYDIPVPAPEGFERWSYDRRSNYINDCSSSYCVKHKLNEFALELWAFLTPHEWGVRLCSSRTASAVELLAHAIREHWEATGNPPHETEMYLAQVELALKVPSYKINDRLIALLEEGVPLLEKWRNSRRGELLLYERNALSQAEDILKQHYSGDSLRLTNMVSRYSAGPRM